MRRAVGRSPPPKNSSAPVEPTVADRWVRWDQEREPSLLIEPRDCPPEALHCRINIGRLFETAMACIMYPKKDHTTAVAYMRLDPAYTRWCAAFGVDRQHTGLTGYDIRRLLNMPASWLSFVPDKHRNWQRLLETMRRFAALDREQSALQSQPEADAWGVRALAWVHDFMSWFPPARGSVYLHVYATHMYRWPRVVDLATHGMEKLNAMLKYDKRFVRRDPKRVGHVSRDPRGALQRILDRRNAVPMLAGYLPSLRPRERSLRCSACLAYGHTRRSLLCPKRSMGTVSRRRASAIAIRARRAAQNRATSTDCDIAPLSSS